MASEDLIKLAQKLATDGPVKTHPTTRQIRILYNGHYIASTTSAIFVWEHPYFPWFYIPSSALSTTSTDFTLTPSQPITSPSSSDQPIVTILTLASGSLTTSRLIHFSPDLTGPAASLAGYIRIEWDAVDAWFEEDVRMFMHPKDPFKRIETLPSSRRVRVKVGGKVVADASSAVHLLETGLPTRYYLPFTAVDASVLRPSTTRSKCPYKGEAEYYSVEVDGKLYEDVIWYYRAPLIESIKVEGLLAFYNEKVEIELDGKVLEQAVSPFSRGGGRPSALST